jgi:hypothetical protein
MVCIKGLGLSYRSATATVRVHRGHTNIEVRVLCCERSGHPCWKAQVTWVLLEGIFRATGRALSTIPLDNPPTRNINRLWPSLSSSVFNVRVCLVWEPGREWMGRQAWGMENGAQNDSRPVAGSHESVRHFPRTTNENLLYTVVQNKQQTAVTQNATPLVGWNRGTAILARGQGPAGGQRGFKGGTHTCCTACTAACTQHATWILSSTSAQQLSSNSELIVEPRSGQTTPNHNSLVHPFTFTS